MRLSALYRYPLKSGRPEVLQQSPSGLLGLEGDRRWMLVDAGNNRFLTQRAFPRMSQLSALYAADGGLLLAAQGLPTLHVAVPPADEALRGVTIWRDTLMVPDAGDAAAEWLSNFMERPVRLVHVPEQRSRYLPSGYGENSDRVAFADGFPLLLIGQASLEDLGQKVGRPMEMLRFRPNLVIEGADAVAATSATAVLQLLASAVRRRSEGGQQAVALKLQGMTQTSIAAELAVSPQAVSKRLQAAMAEEELRVRPVIADLLHRAADQTAPSR